MAVRILRRRPSGAVANPAPTAHKQAFRRAVRTLSPLSLSFD
jgi:hypothetical protein